MPIYTVTCFSHPLGLEILPKDTVKVNGLLQKTNITAEEIENLKRSGVLFRCGSPKRDRKVTGIRKQVTKTGIVKQVIVDPEFIEFELETNE